MSKELEGSPHEISGPRPAARPRAARWRRPAIGFAGLAALGAAIGYLYIGAPDLVRAQILKTIDGRFHRTARLDRVTLDPLRLRADLIGFSLPDRDGRPMIAFGRLHAGLSWPSLLTGRIAFDDLTVDSPQVRLVRRPDGKLNFADLASPPSKGAKSRTPTVRIAHLRLTNGRADVVDAMRPRPIEKRFEHIAFTLRNFVTTRDGGSYALTAETEAREYLNWRGSVGLAPLASKGRFAFEGWRADRLAAMVPEALPFTLSSGVLSAHGAYDLALQGRRLSLAVGLDQAALKGVALRPKGAASDPVRAETVTLSGVRANLAGRRIDIDHILLTRPDVLAARDSKGKINLLQLAPAPKRTSAGPAGKATGPAWRVSAPDVRIAQGRARIEDRAGRGPVAWTADPLDLTLSGLAYPFAGPVQVDAHGAADDGSTFEVKGGLTPPARPGAMPSGGFDVAVDGLELARFQPYVSQAARVAIASGDAFARGRLDLAPGGGMRYSGSLAVDNLRAIDPTLKSDLVTWDRVEASGVVASTKPFGVKVARILADRAYGRVVLEPNYQINIRAVLEQPPAPPPGVAALSLGPAKGAKRPPPRQGPPLDLPIDVARIDFVDGRMDFTDLTVQPHFAAGVRYLKGSIRGLSARAGSRARVSLRGGVDPFAPVVIKGSLEPFAANHFLDMAMQFRNMQLTTFSPYSGKFAGYRIDKGKLDIDLVYKIKNAQLDATHHVVIDQLQLGDKVDSAQATKLPIKLIVALLKDRHGVIDLPIHVTGSLNDPKFRIWPVIWKIVGNLFAKVAASPFTLLGHLVGGGGGESMGRIAFQPGSAALAPEEAAKLASLARALEERPALNVEIPGTVAPKVDGPALSEAAYRRLLEGAYRQVFKRGKPPLDKVMETPKARRRLLEAAYRQVLGKSPGELEASVPGAMDSDTTAVKPLEEALRAHAAAGDRDEQALAQARVQAVQAALVQAGHVDPKRIYVVAGQPLTAGPVMTVSLR